MSPLFNIPQDVETCAWCGGFAKPGTTCPRSLPCPVCKAGPGNPCQRPSGHRAATLHVQRIEQAELIDHRNGITYPEATP